MLGRTGNNLFQYALGRVLAEKHGVPLVMDASWFDAAGWASVSCLRRLDLPVRLVRRLTLGSRALRKLNGRHYWEYRGIPVLKEALDDHRFTAHFLDAPQSCVLMGYFQTPWYFGSIEQTLREELRMDHLRWSPATRRAADRFVSSASVAVHVRRTDYVGNQNADICGPTYYRRAMDRLRGRHEGLQFHLFSDDPGWCHQHLAAPDAEVCDLAEAEGDPLHDLYLMSQARHHVIANSSYSWWAAWLGKRPGQEVLMPDVWFRNGILAPVEEKRVSGWETISPLGSNREDE
jgi:hypothetical protein